MLVKITLIVYLLKFSAGVPGLKSSQSQWLDRLAQTLGYRGNYHHAVIIDAGSTGSRVLAYKFRLPFTVYDRVHLELVEEYFEAIKPGLSSYADDPGKGADTIVQLIKKAEFMTPPKKRKSTPLIVRATAGLRLLPPEKAQALINQTDLAISKLGYDTGPHSVEIMDGSDEGIYIWYTVNLLLGLLQGETIAALDLGGGSTQITYQLTAVNTPQYPSQDQYVAMAGGKKITLYTHSYLKMGIVAAKMGVFLLEADGNNSDELTSVCINPIIQQMPWTYSNKQYYLSGAARNAGMTRREAYNRCHSAVKKYVFKTLDWEPKVAPPGKVAVTSYFYDVAAYAGIIRDDGAELGTVSVAAYKKSALMACSASNVEQPWACIDHVYIISLLQDAYKIPDNQSILVFEAVNGHQVSWALGLAYTTVMNNIGATP